MANKCIQEENLKLIVLQDTFQGVSLFFPPPGVFLLMFYGVLEHSQFILILSYFYLFFLI